MYIHCIFLFPANYSCRQLVCRAKIKHTQTRFNLRMWMESNTLKHLYSVIRLQPSLKGLKYLTQVLLNGMMSLPAGKRLACAGSHLHFMLLTLCFGNMRVEEASISRSQQFKWSYSEIWKGQSFSNLTIQLRLWTKTVWQTASQWKKKTWIMEYESGKILYDVQRHVLIECSICLTCLESLMNSPGGCI